MYKIYHNYIIKMSAYWHDFSNYGNLFEQVHLITDLHTTLVVNTLVDITSAIIIHISVADPEFSKGGFQDSARRKIHPVTPTSGTNWR